MDNGQIPPMNRPRSPIYPTAGIGEYSDNVNPLDPNENLNADVFTPEHSPATLGDIALSSSISSREKDNPTAPSSHNSPRDKIISKTGEIIDLPVSLIQESISDSVSPEAQGVPSQILETFKHGQITSRGIEYVKAMEDEFDQDGDIAKLCDSIQNVRAVVADSSQLKGVA